jgi:hypothetical protein
MTDAPDRNEAPFDPVLFAHGRVLYRFSGSDACRFSPKLAYGLLGGVRAEEPVTLWDPFCGTGLIPCVARLFFPGRFSAVVASDVSAEAVVCAAKNLALVGEPEAARRRLEHVRGLARRNAKSAVRWGAVGDYIESLLPTIERQRTGAPATRTRVASAFDLPRGVATGPVQFVADLPYGASSPVAGGGTLAALVRALGHAYPASRMTFVTTHEAAAGAPADSDISPCRGGRVVIRAAGPAAR